MLENIIGYEYLNDVQKEILEEQKKRFDSLQDKNNLKQMPILNNGLVLKEGTIIHGTSSKIETLKSIKETGILCGQAVGKEEDGETFFCADFHRIPFDISLEEYNEWFPYSDGRCPMGKKEKIGSSKSVAFIIRENDENKELLSYDCYRNTDHGRITKTFVNEKGLPLREEVASSILYGVPSSCIEGIIVGTKVLEDKEKMDFLIKTFPDCYIVYRTGDIIYEPSKEEYVELRKNNALLKRKIKMLEAEVVEKDRVINDSKEKYKLLFDTVLEVSDKNKIIDILSKINYSGNQNVESYVDEIKFRSK